MAAFLSFYVFVGVVWFYQEFRDGTKPVPSLVVGLLWPLDAYRILSNPKP